MSQAFRREIHFRAAEAYEDPRDASPRWYLRRLCQTGTLQAVVVCLQLLCYIVATPLPCQKAGGKLLSSPKVAKAEDHGWPSGRAGLSHFRPWEIRNKEGVKVFFFRLSPLASPKRGRSSATVFPPTVPCQQFPICLSLVNSQRPPIIGVLSYFVLRTSRPAPIKP